MADFNKSFNFRGGFQVDESTFIVRGGTVGIGSTIPKSRLDVDGTITAKGLDVSSESVVGIESANVGFLSATTINVGVASISAGIITATSPAGIVTYYGDARFLQGLPTSQWIDIDVGLGYTSIYASGNVGVDTVDPRYAFQVGGVPFPTTTGPALPAQDGVGIQDGNVYASGIVSTRGEFVGLGSNITAINGSNITVGAIGSMAYGPLIVTEEVIADRFTGIASTAISVTPDATLEFDTARANEFIAVNRFISTEGKLQIGSSDTVSAVGDIDVLKTGANSSVYSLSNQVSKLFVGAQRQSGQARQFGGLRYGLVGSDPLTQINDLDVVNYDIGNLNFYLHSGSGGPGITTGAFRWIYGQSDILLADLSREGLFSLKGNGVPGSTVLEVAGISSFSDAVIIDGDLTVPAGNTITLNGTVDVSGDVEFTGAITFPSQVTLENLLATTEIVVGNPTGTNVTIDPTQIVNGTSIISNGTVDTTTLNVNTINASVLASDTIQYTTLLSGPQFSVDSFGILSAEVVNAASATIPSLNSTDIGVTNINITGSFGFINASGTSIAANSASLGSLSVTGVGTITTLESGDITSGSANINTLTIDNISPILSDINVNGNMVSGGSQFTGLSVLNSTDLICETLSCIRVEGTGPISGSRIILDDITLEFSNLSSNSVRLTFSDSSVPDGAYIDLSLTAN